MHENPTSANASGGGGPDDLYHHRSMIARARAQAAVWRSAADSNAIEPSTCDIPIRQAADLDSQRHFSCLDDVTDLPQGPPTDSFVGYEVERALHRGGQGIVYLAIQKATKRRVAIKVMREGPFATAVDRSRFNREIQILGQLKHPNIVSIHGTGMAAGYFYFVMDFVDGFALDEFVLGERLTGRSPGERLVELGPGRSQERTASSKAYPSVPRDQGALPRRDVLELYVRVCEAVNAAHLRGVIHRDLKPSNIRVDRRGEPHILDFGLAKSGPTDGEWDRMTATGQFLGTLPWAAPEQAEGRPDSVDVRTDVYALGMILYYLLTQSFPFSVAGPIGDLLNSIRNSEPKPLRAFRANIDTDVETIVLKCLEKEMCRRYQSAGELARDLRHFLAREPIEARRDSILYVMGKQLRKRLVPAAALTTFLLMIVVGFIVSAAGWRRANAERNRAESSRAQSQAVTDFLIETIRSANPYTDGAMDTQVREVLDAASKKLDSTFNEQPHVRIAVSDSLYEYYDALGLSSQALEMAQTALAMRRQVYAEDNPEIARGTSQVAGAAVRAAQFELSESLARQGVDLHRRHFGPRHVKVAESLVVLGISLAALGKYAEAEPHFREAAAQFEELSGPMDRASINASFRHAGCLYEMAHLSEARDIMEACVSKGRLALGANHPELANMLSSLGEVMHLQGDLEEAEAAHRESLAIRARAFGHEHKTMANSLNNLAFLLVDQGRFDEAEPLYGQSLDLRRRLYGPRRAEVTYALNGLARLYLKTDRPADAETLLRESISILQETLPGHWRHSYAKCLLGMALAEQEEWGAAEPLIRDGIAGVKEARGPNDYFTQEAEQIGAIYLKIAGRH